MKLAGSCHCGAVSFTVESPHPYPYMYCYCSVCRKTAGGGGYAINLGAVNDSMQIEGQDNINVYQANIANKETGELEQSPAQRHFCRHCGSCLWVWDPRWPELVHPFAAVIDTPLPAVPEHNHIMLDSKPDWVPVNAGENDEQFSEYPQDSLAEWHQRRNLEC